MTQSVQRLATGWTARGLIPGKCENFCTGPDRPWGPSSLLWAPGLFPGSKAAWAWLPTPSSAEVKERLELYHTSTTPLDLLGLSYAELYKFCIQLYIPSCSAVENGGNQVRSRTVGRDVSNDDEHVPLATFAAILQCVTPVLLSGRSTVVAERTSPILLTHW